MRSYFLISLFVIFCSFSQVGIDPKFAKQEIRKINDRYEKLEYINTDVEINYFDSYKSISPTETISGHFFKYKKNTFYDYPSNQVASDGSSTLSIDHENKILVISDNSNFSTKRINNFQFNLDSVLKLCKSVEINKSNNNKSEINFELNLAKIKSIQVYYDSHYIISEINVLINTQVSLISKIQLRYKNLSLKSFDLSKMRLISNYVKKDKAKYKPQPSYSEYKLINLKLQS